VKTVISGEGADELFGGYEWVRLESPYMIRQWRPGGRSVWRAPGASTRACTGRCASWGRKRQDGGRRVAPHSRPGDKTGGAEAGVPERRAGHGAVLVSEEVLASCSDSLQRRLAIDFKSRLAEGILFTMDKVSMAHALEVRMPFLDREVVNFGESLPSRMKVLRGREKRVLAEIARRHLPKEIAERRKHGLVTEGCLEERTYGGIRAANSAGCGRPRFFSFRPYLEENLAAWLQPGAPRSGLLSMVFLQSWWNEFYFPTGALSSIRGCRCRGGLR